MNRPRYKTWCEHVSEKIWSLNRKSLSTPFKLILIDIMAFPAVPGHIKRAPDGSIQSYLEGLFNPTTDRGQITLQIMSQLTMRDLNNLRCTSSTMNTALTVPNVMGQDYRQVTQGRCIRGCLSLQHYCQRCIAKIPPKMAKFCQDCRNFHLRSGGLIDGLRDAIDDGTWKPGHTHARGELCSQCIEKAEVEYPDGIDLCRCVENEMRAVLCYGCIRDRIDRIQYQQYQRRPWPGWPEEDDGRFDPRDDDGPLATPERIPHPQWAACSAAKRCISQIVRVLERGYAQDVTS